MLRRYVQGIGLGAVITLGLFYLMQSFIHTDGSAFSDAPEGRLLDFVRVRDEAEISSRNRKLKRPPPPDEIPPELPKPEFNDDIQSLGADIGAVDINARVNAGFGMGFINDGEYLPIVKVAPIYPRRAQTRGIEGYVLLEFTVTSAGTVRDPFVVESDPPHIFDRAAIQAAIKFKYKPKVVNGEPIEVSGVRNLITFVFEES